MNKIGKALSALCLTWFGVPLLILAVLAILAIIVGIVFAIGHAMGFDMMPVPS